MDEQARGPALNGLDLPDESRIELQRMVFTTYVRATDLERALAEATATYPESWHKERWEIIDARVQPTEYGWIDEMMQRSAEADQVPKYYNTPPDGKLWLVMLTLVRYVTFHIQPRPDEPGAEAVEAGEDRRELAPADPSPST